MKKFLYLFLISILIISLLFSAVGCIFEIPDSSLDAGENEGDETQGDDNQTGGNQGGGQTGGNQGENFCPQNSHADADGNDYCDKCNKYLIVVVDFYAFNDLHGKFCDTDTQPGVDEIGTYLENRKNEDEHIVLLSSGDMWQGGAESVLTNGQIMVDWMNELGFVAMTLGNHEFDWGEEVIRDNALVAEFPFLAINIYNNTTGKLADYCTPSVVIERGDIQIGIIGAIGDCYSSISSDMVSGVNFKVGSELTKLVKAEATRLRESGVDLIVYSLHDGLGSASNSFSHYDTSLSDGYVDVVFEGHSHQAYTRLDGGGVVHIQGGGENYGFSHVEITVNSLTGEKNVTANKIIKNSNYEGLDDHAPTEEIEDKYSTVIDKAYEFLGTVSRKHNSDVVADLVAELYLEAGIEKWGKTYDIVMGGGYLKTRSPYDLSAGDTCYADVLSLLPFNNRITLCRVSGRDLLDKFINSSNSSYHAALKEGFTEDDVIPTAVYFIIVDTYTALYKYNNLTIVDYYDEDTYARDLVADAIRGGRLGTGIPSPDEYTITDVKSALEKGENLKVGDVTTEFLYYKGTLSDFSNTQYGNCYLTDENGDSIYVYGLNDSAGNRYDKMETKPQEGDVVIIQALVKKYQYSSGDIVIELIDSVVIEINP